MMADVSREEIQSAIAKAAELRAIHSALLHNNGSPSNYGFKGPSSSSSSPSVPHHHHLPQFSAHDYPVFTPSYQDEPMPGYRQLQLDSQSLSGYWDSYGQTEGNTSIIVPDYKKINGSSRNFQEYPSELINSAPLICPDLSANNISISKASQDNNIYKSSRRNSLGDLRTDSSSYNKCKPGIINSDSNNGITKSRNFNIVVPLTDSHSSVQTQPKHKGSSFSRFFLRLKKKNKNENLPSRAESENISQGYNDLGIMSIERLKRELIEANERKDAALSEVSEMKSSLGELTKKLENLETYCEELKKALREVIQTRNTNHFQIPKNGENFLPVSEEVMVEGFMQVVSEARLSVKQFCKTLFSQIDEFDSSLVENLDSLLQPYKLSLNSKYTKAVLYHLEGIINQILYQDFENPVFIKNGCPKILDRDQYRQAQFSQFVALRNLSWNEVLSKGTKFYSDGFSKFCDQKMSMVISTLNWTRPWPEQMLQAFFVASKCIWLLHLLAFSFDPPLVILRIEDNQSFDGHYMEDIFVDKQRSHGPSRVKIMVMPGFYVGERVLKCKVLCRYKSSLA